MRGLAVREPDRDSARVPGWLPITFTLNDNRVKGCTRKIKRSI